jgi:CelD/BcsL family acetyltransferase involved in cellulose biosynthesis
MAMRFCDYNAPSLAPGVSARLKGATFGLLWRRIVQRLRCETDLKFDLINLEKMPDRVGAQCNPMRALSCRPHRSGGYVTQLGSDWATFYKSKRSTPTRARDRTKRRKLSEIGEVRTVSVEGAPEMTRILDTLIQQKSRFFACMGLDNMFRRPGRGLVTSTLASRLTHVSSLQVEDAVAAANLGLVFHGCSILVPKRQLQRWIKQSPILWAIVSQSRARLAALGLHRQAPAHTGSAAPR